MKILSVIGARPQFVKAAMVSREIALCDGVQEIIVHTGQHFDRNMSQLFFEEMGLRAPDFNLGIHSMPNDEMVDAMGDKIGQIIDEVHPDVMLVYGDTDSTWAGARTAYRKHLKVCHVEAGLRSGNLAMREEFNRVQTDKVSDLLFAPTETAADNLLREGIAADKIAIVGDVMKDAVFHFRKFAKRPDVTLPDKFMLCTLHRAENTDDAAILKALLHAIEAAAELLPVVMPLHPRTRKCMEQIGWPVDSSPIIFVPPVGYLEMLYLLDHCTLVLTDSGGLQKEAYFFKKCCVTLREETEWTELTDCGCNCLTGHDHDRIVAAVQRFMSNPPLFTDYLYGDAHSAAAIVQTIKDLGEAGSL